MFVIFIILFFQSYRIFTNPKISALIVSIKNKNIRRIKKIIRHFRSVNVRIPNNRNKAYLLHFACSYGNLGLVKLLVKRGANFNVKDKNLWTPLMYALFKEKKKTAKYLIYCGADLNAQTKSGNTALIIATTNYRCFSCIRLLLRRGADPNLQNKAGNTALFYAADSGFFDVVKLLVKYGINVNIKNKAGETALCYSENYLVGDPRIKKFLLAHGAR